ncbi:MAG: NUDIX domain-containing protein [Lysinibacillus sp.]
MKHSGRVIILKDNEVLLIKRVKNDRTYYVFPGGRAEVGETPEMTAIREAYEELGVQVELGDCFETVRFSEVQQYYFFATIVGGELGTGQAEEFTTGEGTYELEWLPVEVLSNSPVIPTEVVVRLMNDI